jgi:hypothetical protein
MAGPPISPPSRPLSAPRLSPCRTWLWLIIVLVAEGVVVEHAPGRGRHRLPSPRRHGVVEGVPGDHTGGPTRREVRLLGMVVLPRYPQPVDVAVVQPEDRIIGGGHRHHRSPNLHVPRIMDRYCESPSEARVSTTPKIPGRRIVWHHVQGTGDGRLGRQGSHSPERTCQEGSRLPRIEDGECPRPGGIRERPGGDAPASAIPVATHKAHVPQ